MPTQLLETGPVAAEPTPAAPMVGVELERVRFRYGATDSFQLEIDSLLIAYGEVFGIVGRSGSGKSTLMHLLALLEDPGSGSRLVLRDPDGLAIYDRETLESAIRSDDDRQRVLERVRNATIGLVFQRPFLLPFLSNGANAALPGALRGDPAAAMDAAGPWFEALGLDGLADRDPTQISGGQEQRFALVRAIAHDPALLLCDEPVSNLDPHARLVALRAIRNHARRGRIVVMVSHELQDHARLSDRIVVVRDGKLFEPFANPADPTDPRPPLPPVGRRTEDDVRRIVATLAACIEQNVGGDEPGPAVEAVLTGEPPRVVVPLEPLGLGWIDAIRHARRQAMGRRQWLSTAVACGLIALVVAVSGFMLDLGRGSVEFLRATLRPGEFVARIVLSTLLTGEHPGLTAAQRDEVRAACPNLVSMTSTRYQFGLAYFDASGRRDQTLAASLEPENPLMEPVIGKFGAATIGVRYLQGGPLRKGQADVAAMYASVAWLRKNYFRLPESAPLPPTPAKVELQLARDAGAWNLPGFNGRLAVPLVVFEVPPEVVREGAEGLEELFLPAGFLTRLGSWDATDGFGYRRIDGGVLADDFDVVESITVTVEASRRLGWRADTLASRVLERRFFPSRAVEHGDGLLLSLSPREQPDHRITPKLFDRDAWPAIRDAVAKASGGQPVYRLTLTKASAVARRLPELAGLPDEPTRVLLRFASLNDVIAAERSLEKLKGQTLANARVHVRYRQAIHKFEAIRTLIDRGSAFIGLGGTAILALLIALTAWFRVSTRSADIAILRVLGMAPRGIARIYRAEVLLIALAGAAAGLSLEAGAAWLSNDTIAHQLADAEPSADAVAAPSGPAPRVFASLVATPLERVGEVAAMLFIVAAVATGSGMAAVGLVRRQKVVPALRAAGG